MRRTGAVVGMVGILLFAGCEDGGGGQGGAGGDTASGGSTGSGGSTATTATTGSGGSTASGGTAGSGAAPCAGSAVDADGDGFGEDDCDDCDASSHPGGIEVCDGRDNDCNGSIDDGAFATLAAAPPAQVSSSSTYATPGGLASDGSTYLGLYTKSQGISIRKLHLDATGAPMPPAESALAGEQGDSFGGAAVWTGASYGVVWQDRRFDNFEVFFTRLGADGVGIGGNVRLSETSGFSLAPTLCWTGSEAIVAWQDQGEGGPFAIRVQRLGADGSLLGAAVTIAPESGNSAAAPAIACGDGVLVAWEESGLDWDEIVYQTFTSELAPRAPAPIHLPTTATVRSPAAVWNRDRYVLAWSNEGLDPQGIFATAVDADGAVLTDATSISEPPAGSRSRNPALRALGDRVLVVYPDDRDGNTGYEIYGRMIGADLSLIGAETRLTTLAGDSVSPVLTAGPAGDIGVLFQDIGAPASKQVFFTRLACAFAP